jgi:hypothetical protein
VGFKPDWPAIEAAKLGADLSAWRAGLVYPVQKALDRLRDMTNRGLSLADNMNAAIVSATLVHGVESPIFNPLKGKAVGFTPIKAVDADGAVIAIPVCTFNTGRTDGLMGVTCAFAPPLGGVQVARNAAQSLGDGASEIISWDVTSYIQGSTLTVSGTTITASAAGILNCSYQMGWSTALAAGKRGCAIIKNGSTGARYGEHRDITGSTGFFALSGAHEIDVSAGDTIGLYTLQSGTGGAINSLTNSMRPRLNLRYVSPAADYSAIVTGILWGG